MTSRTSQEPEPSVTPPENGKQIALLRFLKATMTLPAQVTFYASALAAIALVPGIALPPALTVLASGIGVNAISSILENIAKGQDIPDNEICRQIQEAIKTSQIDKLLTTDEFQRTIAKLVRRQDLMKYALEKREFAIVERLTDQYSEYKVLFSELRVQISDILLELQKLNAHVMLDKDMHHNTQVDSVALATISRFVGQPIEVMQKAVEAELNKKNDFNSTHVETNQKTLLSRLSDGRVTKLLADYYSSDILGQGGLSLYSFLVDGYKVETHVATKPKWLQIDVPLSTPHDVSTSENFQLIKMDVVNKHVDNIDLVASLLASVIAKGQKSWNAPIYRLGNIAIKSGHVDAVFAAVKYYDYRFTVGLLVDELIEALTVENFDPIMILANKSKFFPLREQLLASGSQLINLNDRICAGGTPVCLAIARPAPYKDFAIPIQRRSGLVFDAPRMVSVVPKAFHSHVIDESAEINLSSTIFRELFEELFKGEEMEKLENTNHLTHDWYFEKMESMRYFLDHNGTYNVECTCFGFNLVQGNYEFGSLLAIRDEYYWNNYKSSMEKMWEYSNIERFVSSRNPAEISDAILNLPWTGEGLFSFVEGLRRLEKIDPSRVNLPKIEITSKG